MSESGSVSIPDEALQEGTDAAEDAFLARELPWSDADVIAERIVEAAAPYIDRAARIDELKRLLQGEAGIYAMDNSRAPNSWLRNEIEARIAELEARR